MKRKLQKTNKDQYLLTIPKKVIKELGWQDKTELSFQYENSALFLQQKPGAITRRLQRTNKNQYLLTIPKTLIAVTGWLPKEAITFTQRADAILLRGSRK